MSVPEQRAPGPRGAALWGWLPVLAAGAMYAERGWARRWVSDDAFITLRSVQNLLAGHGPVFNVGERVESSTSTVWELVLAAVGPLRGLLPLEWWAVLLGLACAIGGLVLAQVGAVELAGGAGGAGGTGQGRRLALPLGALVVCALPPFWDFATSGLETGMVFGWLGLCFWGLARAWARRTRVPWWLAVAIGLGPLVRPDLAVFTAGFAALALALSRPFTWRGVARLALWGGAVPVLYELFRMAYYAAVVPTPAVAKSAAAAWWSQGRLYLSDLANPYRLWLPAAVAAGAGLTLVVRMARRREPVGVALLAVPPLCGLVHGLFVVRVGGDFMHGRLLLPSLFGLLLPVMAVPVPRPSRATAATAAAVGAVALWAIVCGTSWRVPYPGIGPHGIADERSYYLAIAQRAHPVRVGDYAKNPHYQAAVAAKAVARTRPHHLLVDDDFLPRLDVPLQPDVGAALVARHFNIGVFGYAAGPNVFVADELGLADPIGARLIVHARTRPGHEKFLVAAWHIARFADPSTPIPPGDATPEDVAAARQALACPPVRALLTAVDGPLTFRRALSNMAHALRFTRLRLDPAPVVAAREVC